MPARVRWRNPLASTVAAIRLGERSRSMEGEVADVPTIDSLDELDALVRERPEVCIRFSKGPRADLDDTSVDYESGLELPGLSCNRLRPEPWWTRDVRDWLARQICHYVHLGDEPDREAWLLEGEEAGRGPDREPLLSPWRPVAWLSENAVREARERYEERFDAGRDSTSTSRS